MNLRLWINGKEVGPFGPSEIAQMIIDGTVSGHTLAMREEETKGWVELSQSMPSDLIMAAFKEAGRWVPANAQGQSEPEIVLAIQLSSGVQLNAARIELYDESLVQGVASLRGQAMKKLGGWSSGLGFIGSVEGVMASSLAVGAVEALVSASHAAEARQLLAQAIDLDRNAKKSGKFVPVFQIANIDRPAPSTWRADYTFEEPDFISWSEDPAFVMTKTSRSFVHDGEDFVRIRDANGGESSIRWSLVEQHALSK